MLGKEELEDYLRDFDADIKKHTYLAKKGNVKSIELVKELKGMKRLLIAMAKDDD